MSSWHVRTPTLRAPNVVVTEASRSFAMTSAVLGDMESICEAIDPPALFLSEFLNCFHDVAMLLGPVQRYVDLPIVQSVVRAFSVWRPLPKRGSPKRISHTGARHEGDASSRIGETN